MYFTKTITSAFLFSLAMAVPFADSSDDALPAGSAPMSELPGVPAFKARDLERRTNLVSFVNYQSPGCTGSATNHFPQTAGVCHTITGNSVNYYARYGQCTLEFYTDSKCTNGNSLGGNFGCYDISTRRSYRVLC